jgi:streptomycin 6-kinase
VRPDALSAYLDLWNLTLDGEPFETASSRLAFVTTGGRPAVLKIPKPASDEHGTARVFSHWGDRAAVRVLRHDDRALLMERALPGTTLVPLVVGGRDDEACHILSDVMLALHVKPAPEGDWKRIEADWARGFARQRARPPHPVLTYDLIDRAEAVYTELAASQAERFLLHGDLHHENVLIDRERGPLAIDPKGVVGELAYEIGPALGNPIPHIDFYAQPAVMERRVGIFADRLKLPAERILKWCYSHWILGAIWDLEDHGDIVLDPRLLVPRTAQALLERFQTGSVCPHPVGFLQPADATVPIRLFLFRS